MANPKSKKSSNTLPLLLNYGIIALILSQTFILLLQAFSEQASINPNLQIVIGVGIALLVVGFVLSERHQLTTQEENCKAKLKEENEQYESIQKNNPKLSAIPIFGPLYAKWQIEPLVYKIGLLGLCILAGIIYGYELSYYDWLPDEPLVVKSAKGYLETGSFTKWDFWLDAPGTENYDRAWPHTWMVAQSIRLFGILEWSTRLVSGFCGILFILITYGVSYFFLKNRLAAFIVTFVCLMNPYLIVYFRRVRMYALLLPVFMILVYLIYRVLTVESYRPKFIYQNKTWAKKFLNYEWPLVIATLIMIYLSVEIHKLSYIIFPVMLPLFLYQLIAKKQVRLIVPLAIAALGLFIFSGVAQEALEKFVLFDLYNDVYIKYYLDFPFPKITTIGILLAGILITVLSKFKAEWILLYSVVVVSLIMYVYVIDFPGHFRYALHLLPFSFMLSIGLLLKVNELFSTAWKRTLIPIMICITVVAYFASRYEWIYKKFPEAQFASQAYETIQSRINPETEGLIGLYVNEMYLKGLGKSVRLVEIPNRQQYTTEEFRKDLQSFKNGAWVTWFYPQNVIT